MTMTVYTFEVVEGQEWIFPADEDHFEMFFALDGSVISGWDPPVMAIDSEERSYSDFPWLGEHVPFLRKPAVEALSPILQTYGQLLPVRGADVRLFNATTVIDALDVERSGIVHFDDGSILAIERHVFDASRIGTAEVFKLPMRASAVYVTEAFVERVRQAGLRGVSFKALWRSATLDPKAGIGRACDMTPDTSKTRRTDTTGLRRFLDLEQQRAWMAGKAALRDTDERAESPELRFRYVARYQKLLRRPQAQAVLEILRLYGRDCLPIPVRTERDYWSVSCLPSTPGKALIRVNASWMEFFSLYADGDDIRALFLVHLSDFTRDRSAMPDQVDEALLERCVKRPEDVSWFIPRGADIFGIKVRGIGSIRKFMAPRRALRAIRAFNLTHMNRGRNAYQASHCYSLADHMLGR